MSVIKRIGLIILSFVMLSTTICASAKSIEFAPYKGYDYNNYKESKAAPVGYLASSKVTGADLKLEKDLGQVSYFSYDSTNPDKPFILMIDGGRIIETDGLFNVNMVYDNFVDTAGSAVDITGTQSAVLNQTTGILYIADTAHNRLLVADKTGQILTIITSGSIGGSAFSPYRMVLNGENKLLVLSKNTNNGYYQFFQSGEFEMFVPVAGADLRDIVFDSSTACLYALNSNGSICNITENTIIPISTNISGAFSFAVDTDNGYFYIIGSNKNDISKVTLDGSIEANIKSTQSVAGLSFQKDKGQLLALDVGIAFRIFSYNTTDKLVSTISKVTFKLNQPTDMLYDNKDTIYILDSGNGRILELNQTLTKVKDICAGFVSKTNGLIDITGSQGMYIANGQFYIADTEHERVIICDLNGRVNYLLLKPESLSKSLQAPFRASKVILDRNGEIYVLADSVNMGAFVFTKDYKFKSFFGSNTVTTTAEVLLNFIRKKFLTREQMSAIKNYTPITLTNFDMDSSGFLYTVSELSETAGLVRKLNYTGSNVIGSVDNIIMFGDLEWDRQFVFKTTSFTDIDIDNEGFTNLIDATQGKIFQYSPEGQLISVFGGLGKQLGLFKNPKAIESIGDKIYVIDGTEGSISIFSTTSYVGTLREAILKTNNADPKSAIVLWNNVLKSNTNSQYPYYKLGMAYETKGDYKYAMVNFKLASAHSEYSKAFREYRKVYVKDNFWWIFLIGVLIIAGITIILRFIKKKMVIEHGEAYSPLETKAGLPIYTLFHPIDGFEQFRHRNLQSIKLSFGLVAAWFLLKIFQFFCTGFVFNENRAIDYNLFSTLLGTVVVFVLFVIANWGIGTFLNGKGRLKEIIAVYAYSLIPQLIAIFANTLLSNVLTHQEAAFIGIISVVGILWSVIILLMGLSTIHEYSFLRTIVSIILTGIGMAVIALLVILFFTLMQQFVSFINSIIYEIKMM